MSDKVDILQAHRLKRFVQIDTDGDDLIFMGVVKDAQSS